LLSAPTQAGGTINITGGEPNESLNLAITMTYFDSVYFGSLDFAPISAPTVFATYNIVAGSVQLDLNGNASASYYGTGWMLHASVRITGRSSGGPLPVDDTVYISNS
jgi:hypothetical protein